MAKLKLDPTELGMLKMLAQKGREDEERDAKVCETCGRTGAEGCDEAKHWEDIQNSVQEILDGTAETEPFDSERMLAEIDTELMADINRRSFGELVGMVLDELCENTTLYHQNDLLLCVGCNGTVPQEEWEAGVELNHSPWCITQMAMRCIEMLLDKAEAVQAGASSTNGQDSDPDDPHDSQQH